MDLDNLILEEIRYIYKTVRRIHEDLCAMGMEVEPLRIDTRMRSLRKFNLVEFKILDFPIPGRKPIAYKMKIK